MEITKTTITVKDLATEYVNDSEVDPEKGVYAYGGKLCVRPAFQRSFVYNTKQENAVIDTALKGFPLNIMYWVDNGDGTYDCLDGQQRTISLCNFVDGISYFKAPWLNEGKETRLVNLRRMDPALYERFMNYELTVYICQGDKKERMEWFKTINIAGEKLFNQELRNANYTSAWLTDAKHYFSKTSPSAKSLCAAERKGGEYTNKNANRQEILEQVISWYIGSNKDEDICQYMEDHLCDDDASELWNYFVAVVDWVDELFPESGRTEKGFDTVDWGYLYNNYGDKEFDAAEMENTLKTLIGYKATKELDVSMSKILQYCITRDETLLKHRSFSEAQKSTMYNRQNGICPKCGGRFKRSEMDAHHIVSWRKGGITDLENGVMWCKNCHKDYHA